MSPIYGNKNTYWNIETTNQPWGQATIRDRMVKEPLANPSPPLQGRDSPCCWVLARWFCMNWHLCQKRVCKVSCPSQQVLRMRMCGGCILIPCPCWLSYLYVSLSLCILINMLPSLYAPIHWSHASKTRLNIQFSWWHMVFQCFSWFTGTC